MPARPKGSTPRKASASWMCETIDSRVFSDSRAAPRPREWLAADAAGALRERVNSAPHAEVTFYQSSRPRPEYMGQREMMGEILYGADPAGDSRHPKKGAVGRNVFLGAAGHRASVPDRPDREAADRHPDLQKNVKASCERRCANSCVGHSDMGVRGESDASSAPVVAGGGRAGAPTPRGGAAHALIYAPQTEAPSEIATPRRLKSGAGPGGGSRASATNIRPVLYPEAGGGRRGGEGGLTPAAATHAHAGEGEWASAADPVTIGGGGPFSGGLVYTSAGRVGRRSWTPACQAPTAMPSVLGMGDGAAVVADYTQGSEAGSERVGGVRRRVPPGEKPPKSSGRATGEFNPASAAAPAEAGSAAAAAVVQAAAAAAAGVARPCDAGVSSRRLHQLERSSASHCPQYTLHSASDRRAYGSCEGRAGAGPYVPAEVRVCGLSRRPPTAKDVASRNPVLGHASAHSPAAPRGCGRLHLDSVPAACDHLDPTLVPQPLPAEHLGRTTGKGVGGFSAAAHGALLPAAAAPTAAAAAGWSLGGAGGCAGGGAGHSAPTPSCGKRHVDAPTHEPVPFELSHPQPAATPRDAAAATPRDAAAASRGSVRTPLPSPSRTAPFGARESARARADANAAYAYTRARGTSSTVFSDLAYPDISD